MTSRRTTRAATRRTRAFHHYSIGGELTPEMLGVGYIIGSRGSGILFAGGIISWLVIMPAIRFYGQLANNVPIYPSTIPIPLMSPDQIWGTYIRPMGAGAVAAAGLITLLRTLPTIFSALKAGLGGDWLRIERSIVSLGADVEIDVRRFRELAAAPVALGPV